MLREPQTMTGANVFIEGVGFIGTTKEVDYPKLEFTTWTSNSGLGEREVDTGLLKAMTATFTFEEYNKIYFEILSKRWNEKANIYVKQNITEGIKQIPLVVTFKGNLKSIEFPKYEHGKEVNVVLELAVSFYKFEYNNDEQFLVDLNNMIFTINGQDKFQEIRANLL
jgi:P2 family phage contractile tail tube protein